jgi:hypothetical protein
VAERAASRSGVYGRIEIMSVFMRFTPSLPALDDRSEISPFAEQMAKCLDAAAPRRPKKAGLKVWEGEGGSLAVPVLLSAQS